MITNCIYNKIYCHWQWSTKAGGTCLENWHIITLCLWHWSIPHNSIIYILHIESDVTYQPWHKVHTHWLSFCITQVITNKLPYLDMVSNNFPEHCTLFLCSTFPPYCSTSVCTTVRWPLPAAFKMAVKPSCTQRWTTEVKERRSHLFKCERYSQLHILTIPLYVLAQRT